MDNTLAQILESHQNLVALIVAERKEKATLAEERDALKARVAELERMPVMIRAEEGA